MTSSRLVALFLLLATCTVVATSPWSAAQEEELPSRSPASRPPETDARHYSYAIGLDIGASFGNDQIELDVESLVAGLKDGLKRAEPRYSREMCGVAMQRLARERMEVLKKRNQAFLAENGKANGIEVTKSGLQYQVLESGKGSSPKATDTVKVHYQGSLIDGSVFDSSAGGPPAEFALTRPDGRPGVISGWVEALQMMKPGDRWRLFIPADIAYGEQGFGEVIPPHSTLIFELELLDIL
ncbi:FKBP-type peptidyl-prolyl cis-trans isomerase [Adhaeretor mobilis]|uniref:Peptidyl-prolyl cis-trans isomerase n=1 Tax=Adhaeretor mobilis TaxID=1930276 RepID=A0A517MQV6_9BACT|nr:FKBP-type peptidyl-prolyl cis-trans isomerase [Adhaeretor mobilis]QDS97265.1 FKBP-type 22 kDa peptidyl-prolyl cis-trans isomerase [Adhaeretor mobilis]